MSGRRAKITRLLLGILVIVSIGFGFVKIFTHFNSVWRWEPLDYIVAVGAVVGGLFIFVPKVSKVILTICFAFIVFEAYKAIIDFLDFGDILLCVTAIICLIIPIIKYRHRKKS